MDELPQNHFEAKRRAFEKQIGSDGVAILTPNPEQSRTGGTMFRYRPSSDIMYLTGFRQPGTVLVIAPGHDKAETAFFVREPSDKSALWEGARPGKEQIKEEYGADKVHFLSELDEVLPEYLEDRRELYYTFGEDPEFDRKVTGWLNSLRHSRSQAPKAPGTIRDLRDILHRMRLYKNEAELERMRRAARISGEAHVLAMQHCQPGRREYELQSVIEHHFMRSGATYPAYPTIVGSGDNSTVLHYTDNSARIEQGDIVLVDAGCEYQYFAGDITRCFPADGTFSSPQRRLYNAVLDVQQTVVEFLEPGISFKAVQDKTARELTERLIELGILEGSVEKQFEEDEYEPYFPHKVGHWIGRDVHDVGLYRQVGGEWQTLAPGMVLTIEPGLYIPQGDDKAPEAFQGTGIRIEDDVAIAEDGTENLSKDCPKQPDEIESLVGSDSTLLES